MIAIELLETEHERLMRDHYDDGSNNECDGCARAHAVRDELATLKGEHPVLVQWLKATNDLNGNPRRLYALYDADGTARFIDEGYGGRRALVEIIGEEAYAKPQLPDLKITRDQYYALAKTDGKRVTREEV